MEMELSIFVGKTANDLSTHSKHLDVCDIHPVGFSWGTEERERVVIVKANLTTEEQSQLLEGETEIITDPNYDSDRGATDSKYKEEREFTALSLRYRKYTIDVTKLSNTFKTALDKLSDNTVWNERQFFSGITLSDDKPLSSVTRLEVIKPILK